MSLESQFYIKITGKYKAIEYLLQHPPKFLTEKYILFSFSKRTNTINAMKQGKLGADIICSPFSLRPPRLLTHRL